MRAKLTTNSSHGIFFLVQLM